MNPTAVAIQQRTAELERLRKENEALRDAIRQLERPGGGHAAAGAAGGEGSLERLNPVQDAGPSAAKQVEGA